MILIDDLVSNDVFFEIDVFVHGQSKWILVLVFFWSFCDQFWISKDGGHRVASGLMQNVNDFLDPASVLVLSDKIN